MKKIENKGNLPKHLQLFATASQGIFSGLAQTEFYEMSSISEFERTASGQANPDIKFEIFPTIDTSTNRGFLIGFDASTPETIATLTQYSYLKIYFVETASSEINIWIEKIKRHRDEQMEEAKARKKRFQDSKINATIDGQPGGKK